MVVEAGVAVTVVPVPELSVAAGVQVYVFAPDAVSAILLPIQIAAFVGDTPIVGNAFATTLAVFVEELQPLVPVTVAL